MKSILIGIFLGFVLISAVSAEPKNQPSTQEIIKALEIPEEVRKQGGGIRSARGVIKTKKFRKPSINLRIEFEYDSARLTNEGILTIKRLANALNNQKLNNDKFLIVGHTDARGSDDYNQELSERRANAVVSHLTSLYKISFERLIAEGKGESHLFDPQNPESGVNRRVQITNLGK